MGRELRQVPANWEHPKDEDGDYIPLIGDSFTERLSDWEEGKKQWDEGFRLDLLSKGWKPKEPDELLYTFEEWDGERPVKEDYMPEWEEKEKTHIQLYENTTEGTPISPVFAKEDFEKLCEYAAENCTTFAEFKASKEDWIKMLTNNFVHHTQGNVTFI